MKRNSRAIVLSLVTGVAGFAASALAAGELEDQAAQGLVTTTEYFLMTADGSTSIVDSADEMRTIGKPGGTLSTATGMTGDDVRCGSYKTDDVGGYSTSSHFNGTLAGVTALFATPTAGKPLRIPNAIFWVGTRPSSNKRLSSIAIYKENATYDTGKCIEGSGGSAITYFKYSATMD